MLSGAIPRFARNDKTVFRMPSLSFRAKRGIAGVPIECFTPIGVSSSSSRRRDADATRSALVASASRQRLELLETSVGIIPVGVLSGVKPTLESRPRVFALTPHSSPIAWEKGAERERGTSRSPSPASRERGQGVRAISVPATSPEHVAPFVKGEKRDSERSGGYCFASRQSLEPPPLGSPYAVGGTTLLWFPSRSGGNLKEGGRTSEQSRAAKHYGAGASHTTRNPTNGASESHQRLLGYCGSVMFQSGV